MRVTVKKWGNSAAVRLPASIVQATQLELDEVVEVLTDQIKSLDWRVRRGTRKGAASAEELADVRAKIFALIG
jgi:antitoxin component of MazEF toxin-antitoxin module